MNLTDLMDLIHVHTYAPDGSSPQVTIGLHKSVMDRVLGLINEALNESGEAANIITSWHGEIRCAWGMLICYPISCINLYLKWGSGSIGW